MLIKIRYQKWFPLFELDKLLMSLTKVLLCCLVHFSNFSNQQVENQDKIQIVNVLLFYRKTAEEDKNKKRGYCECCCVHYEDLDKVRIQPCLATIFVSSLIQTIFLVHYVFVYFTFMLFYLITTTVCM